MSIAVPRLDGRPAYPFGRALHARLAAWRQRQARHQALRSLLDMNPRRLADLGLSSDTIEAAFAARHQPHQQEISR
ncbi:DUF1127 domain-containing protein [Paradevosia shaoguanensis]|uniref:DUF1127 domain-containing protein n=1 Tax=Paradevosia shaoguanensis TaxID=1335043 RepID=UPI003C77CC40